jgi:hypothetical protein
MLAILLSFVLAGQGPDEWRARQLQVAGEERPEIFLKHLVLASIPAGGEILHFDSRLLGATSKPWPPEVATASRQELVVAFNNGHVDYEAKLMGEVIVIRPSGIEGTPLEEKAPVQRIQARGLIAAIQQLYGKSAGQSGVFYRGADPAVVFDMSVADMPIIQVLNKLVTQARGNAWVVDGRAAAGVLFVQANGFIFSAPVSRIP